MKVCLDIQAAVAQRAGVGRYTDQLARHLPAFQGEDELRGFFFDFSGKADIPALPKENLTRCAWVPGRFVQQAWKRIDWPPFDWLSGSADVFHFPNFVCPPLRRGKAVVTIHDLSFIKHPETMEEANFRYLSAKIADTVQRADLILTDSHCIADELQEAMGVPREKLRSVWLGLAKNLHRPVKSAIDALRQERGLDRPYLLHVGTLEPRKNHRFLFDVFDALDAFDGDLVLAGAPGWKTEAILARLHHSPKRERIKRLQYVRDEELPALYAGAEMLVFPSLYEGFGFPPLEAMACGTPSVVSAGGSLPEVVGPNAVVVPDFDVEHWVTAIQGLLADTQRREGLIRMGIQHARKFTWEEAARRTWDVYRELHP